MNFTVQFSAAANEDLQRIFDFLIQRELDSPTGDMAIPEKARHAIHAGIGLLQTSPFVCRKVGDSPFTRELIIAFGSTGYVALFEIINDTTVIVGAILHQREDDYH
jgi:plasmid stabilization system protein ParE